MFTLQPAASEALAELLGRIARVAHRHPALADQLLEALSRNAFAAGDTAVGVDALYARFGLLEPRGRALELLPALEQAGALAAAGHFPVQAARVCEALGRIAYQQGEYQLASEQWSRALDLAEVSGHCQAGVAARIGLGQIHYAQADWARGLRQMRDAGEQLARSSGEGDDSYLAAKLALNIGVGSFETGDLPAAERHFSHGLAAARRGAHHVFEAEAHWHLARAALARQRMDWAVADCRLALDIAARQGYPWLEAAASRTWTEIALARGDNAGAVRSTRHGLALAQRIQARAQARQAHLQLAELLQAEGDAAGALDHLWQHLALQSEIERLSLPARATLAAPPAEEGGAPLTPEELLLHLCGQRQRLAAAPPPEALAELKAASSRILGLASVIRWQLGSGGLSAANQPRYLDLLNRHGAPLALPDSALHPCHAELASLPGAAEARIEVPLYDGARLAGALWFVDARATRAWTRQELLIASELALLFEAISR
ncbi:GAF domain-containing protein [Roseateles saccharophilus]|uniref:GAF domain-containing protein n=1 Tax=Roseateles saccharophilus TaxID=304 RepID=A0A4R3UG36_ROSSA|nr:GAF domain-containing protein [Roseateles saccharophilus]MDG0835441.1 GAF domain-containing protein [Roseateles saccharophilus]TCU86330.1 GAF domain-containing protein [Roseateles saccharophilus]